MKKIFIILIMFQSCSITNEIEGKYMLEKNPNSFNLSVELFRENVYILRQTGTGVSGMTKGIYKKSNGFLTLIPEKRIPKKELIGNDTVEVVNYRPYDDTLKLIIKRKKVILIDKSHKIVLKKTGNVGNGW